MSSNVITCSRSNSPDVKDCSDGFTIKDRWFRYDPFRNPLPDSQPMDLFGSVDIAPGATRTLLTITLGRNEWARFDRIGQEILDDPAGTAIQGFQDITWNMRINGSLHKFYGVIVDQIGRGDIGRPINLRIMEERAVIEISATNSSGVNTYKCFISLQGWAIPLPY